MNDQEIVKRISNRTGLSLRDSRKVLQIILKLIGEALEEGEKVTIVGFGTFSISNRAARKGRNLQTGAELRIPAKNVVKFKRASRIQSLIQDYNKEELLDSLGPVDEYVGVDMIDVEPSMDHLVPVEKKGKKKSLSNKKYVYVKVYFGTDRKLDTEKKNVFSNERADLSYGQCRVSIPKIHKIGEIESPIFNLKWLQNVNKHIILQDTSILSKVDFHQSINDELKNCDEKSSIIFFHGFNVNFENAAKRTAQLAYDLKFKGIPCFYSWPSAAKLSLYAKDEETIQLSEQHVKKFLLDFLSTTTTEKVYLIGHSMGTRVLSKVIAEIISLHPEINEKIKEIILAAPDINAEIFKQDIAPHIVESGQIITLYASSEDKALKVSRTVHDYSRAGESGDSLVDIEGVEAIDATGIDISFLKHSYFGESRTVIGDIYNLILNNNRPNKRSNLVKLKANNKWQWKFKE